MRPGKTHVGHASIQTCGLGPRAWISVSVEPLGLPQSSNPRLTQGLGVQAQMAQRTDCTAEYVPARAHRQLPRMRINIQPPQDRGQAALDSASLVCTNRSTRPIHPESIRVPWISYCAASHRSRSLPDEPHPQAPLQCAAAIERTLDSAVRRGTLCSILEPETPPQGPC